MVTVGVETNLLVTVATIVSRCGWRGDRTVANDKADVLGCWTFLELTRRLHRVCQIFLDFMLARYSPIVWRLLFYFTFFTVSTQARAFEVI